MMGIDPIDARRAERARQRLDAAKVVTFKECGEAYIASHRAGWRNEKHKYQWSATLSTYAYPIIGALPVQAVDTGLVLKVLQPIWTTKPETASRVRQRIENILDFAKVRGWRAQPERARHRCAERWRVARRDGHSRAQAARLTARARGATSATCRILAEYGTDETPGPGH